MKNNQQFCTTIQGLPILLATETEIKGPRVLRDHFLIQCLGLLLLLHTVGQGPAVLAADAGWVCYIFYVFHLPSISNVLSFWETVEHD